MIKLKDILNEKKEKQFLSESVVSETLDLLYDMAKNEVKNNFEELIQFMDIDKIEKDLPSVSIRDIQSNLIKSVTQLKATQKVEGKLNENLSNFILSIKNKIEDLITNINKFIQAISRIPAMVRNLKYIKNIKGFMNYYSKNLTTDGIVYKGINNKMINSFKTNVNEGIFTNNKSITSFFSMMFVVMMMAITLNGCSSIMAQEKIEKKELTKRQDTTNVVDTDVKRYRDYKSPDPISHIGGDSPIRPNIDSRTRRELSKTLDRMDREWQGIEKSTRFNMPRAPR